MGLLAKKRLILGTLVAFSVSVAANFVSVPMIAIETTVAPQGTVLVAQAEEKEVPARVVVDSASIEHEVRAYFADIPLLAEVAWCESRFVQTDPTTGEVKRGHLNSSDLGVMQINEYYHGAEARRMGLDLHTLRGNLAYARYLYEREGTRPWSASEFCWGHHDTIAMR